MNGNFGRTYAGNTSTPLHHQQQNSPGGNGYIFTGRAGGSRHMGPCGTRNFYTGNLSGRNGPPSVTTTATTTMPTTKGFAPHPHNSYQANPGGFINGIKNIVNGFINPKMKSDYYWDHNRHYNPKYRNNYMMDHRQSNGPSQTAAATAQCNASLKTVFVPLISPTAAPTVTSVAGHAPRKPEADGIEIAIFTSDDFPALPAIKKHSTSQPIPASITKTTTKSAPTRCQKQQPAKPPPTKQPATSACSSSSSDEKDLTCDFIVLTNPNSKICNPVAATTNTCNRAIGFPFRCRPRTRQISECSDDSFVICFSDDAPEGVLEVAHDSDSDDDSDFDVDSGDSEDDDDIDETDNHVRISSETNQLDSGFDDGRDKKVRFNLNPQIHMMYKWDFAYRAARKGHWENFARDRCRFTKRIDIMSKILSPILDTQHRENVYRTRFCYSENSATSD